jgi:hypothetical protein
MEATALKITKQSIQTFIKYAKEAGDWAGNPMVDGSAEERGNLTQLKKAGLIETFNSDGIKWLRFTPSGRAYAEGFEISTLNWTND